jgi:hypothetical protein
MAANLLYQYYCAKCNSILKESPIELAVSPTDLCPNCSSFLTETLQRKSPAKTLQKYAPTLRTALDLAVPSFGVPRLDAIIGKYTTSICLTGCHAETLFWRAIVKSLLPRRAGGSGFSKVLLIDAGNCSDIYLCVDYARQYGLSLDKLLDSIIVTRAFTVYQLTALAREISEAAGHFGADLVAMADMAHMFTTDPQMEKEEGRLAGRIADSLASASKQLPVMAFASSFQSSDWVSRFDVRVAGTATQGKVMLSAFAGKLERSCVISERDLFQVAKGD